MSNGVFEIEIEGKLVRLRFNVQAGLLFQSLVAAHQFKAKSQESNIAFINDLFYVGLYGEALYNRTQCPTPQQAMDIFELFAVTPNFLADSLRMWEVWGQSVIGSAYIEAGSKKKEPESQL